MHGLRGVLQAQKYRTCRTDACPLQMMLLLSLQSLWKIDNFTVGNMALEARFLCQLTGLGGQVGDVAVLLDNNIVVSGSQCKGFTSSKCTRLQAAAAAQLSSCAFQTVNLRRRCLCDKLGYRPQPTAVTACAQLSKRFSQVTTAFEILLLRM